MKRVLLFFVIIMATVSAYAQNMYRSTGNNVNVREGPGKNYGVKYDGNGYKWQLSKNDAVRYLGKKKNGFMYIEGRCLGGNSWSIEKGWVSAQYLKLMTNKCPNCNGQGYFNRKCTNYGDTREHPMACSCQHTTLTPNGGLYSAGAYPNHIGKQICNRCSGIGYLK